MHSKNQFQSNIVRFIVEGAAEQTTRSLELLRAIETTVQVNDMLAESFEQSNHRISKAIEAICGRPTDNPKSPIDADGAIRASIEQTLDVSIAILGKMESARESAGKDNDLCHDDGVVESFDKVIAALTEAHETMNELNWAIMEHDADRSPLSGKGPFKSVDELIAALTQ